MFNLLEAFDIKLSLRMDGIPHLVLLQLNGHELNF